MVFALRDIVYCSSGSATHLGGGARRESGARVPPPPRGARGDEEEEQRPGFTFSLISTLSVTTGNDNRLIIADKSPIPADKDVRIQKTIIDYLSMIIDKNRR